MHTHTKYLKGKYVLNKIAAKVLQRKLLLIWLLKHRADRDFKWGRAGDLAQTQNQRTETNGEIYTKQDWNLKTRFMRECVSSKKFKKLNWGSGSYFNRKKEEIDCIMNRQVTPILFPFSSLADMFWSMMIWNWHFL